MNIKTLKVKRIDDSKMLVCGTFSQVDVSQRSFVLMLNINEGPSVIVNNSQVIVSVENYKGNHLIDNVNLAVYKIMKLF
ncbi:MAG: hypothetical protein HDR31_00050 [Mycoplasma sp.]|nr:hypothetical protein [Mycoplasma sp.]